MMDWYEQELEDYIVENPFPMFDAYFPLSADGLEIGLLGRQVRCRYGIIDLLFYTTLPQCNFRYYEICIVEVKAVPADRKTVEQVTRYKSAVEETNFYMLMPDDDFAEFGALIHDHIGIRTLIVAPGFHKSIDWLPNGVIVTKSDDGFVFSGKPFTGFTSNNTELDNAIAPVVHMATGAAKQHELGRAIRRSMNSLSANSRFSTNVGGMN